MDRQLWVDAAREMLIQQGIDNVKVDRIAKKLGVTRGSFHWHFRNRQDLLDALLVLWCDTNTRSLEHAINSAAGDGRAQLVNVFRLWLYEEDYSPAFDLAVRAWARTSSDVSKCVADMDSKRIKLLVGMYCNLGFGKSESLVRANLTYYHQMEYFATGIKESRRKRLRLAPTYFSILSEISLSEEDIRRSRCKHSPAT